MVMKRSGSDPSLPKKEDTNSLSSWKSPIYIDDPETDQDVVEEPSRTSLRESSAPSTPGKAGKGRWKSLKNRLSIGKRKSVKFAKGKPEVRYTLSRHDLSPIECEDYWLQSYEMEQSLSRCWEIVYAFKKTKKEAKGKKVAFNYCTRGLESYIVDKCNGEHKHRLKREYAYSAVLLRGDGVSDKERSRRYQLVSKASVVKAIEYGRRDEVIARRIHSEAPDSEVPTSCPDDASEGTDNTHATEPLSDESNRKFPSNKSLEVAPPKSPRKKHYESGCKSRCRSPVRSSSRKRSERRSSVEPIKPKSLNDFDSKEEKESTKKTNKKDRGRSKSPERSSSRKRSERRSSVEPIKPKSLNGFDSKKEKENTKKSNKKDRGRSKSTGRTSSRKISGRKSSVEPTKPKSLSEIHSKKEKESTKKSKKKDRGRSKSRSRSPSKSTKAKPV